MYTFKLKKLRKNAKIPFRATPGSAGMDNWASVRSGLPLHELLAALTLEREQAILKAYNDWRRSKGLPEDKLPSACIGCGKCARICPQNIDIPKVMKQADEIFRKLPSWAEICRKREAEGR